MCRKPRICNGIDSSMVFTIRNPYRPQRKPLNHQIRFWFGSIMHSMNCQTPPHTTWGVYSNNAKLIKKFCKQVITTSQDTGIYKRIHSLASKISLTPDDHKELDDIDQDLTHILVKADQACVKAGNAPWSPQLHKAYLVHHYWSLKLSQMRTGRNYLHAFTTIKQKINLSKLKLAHLLTISANLWAAQTQLCKIHKVAQEKRQAHLKELIQAAGICKDQRKRKLILCLKRAKELFRC